MRVKVIVCYNGSNYRGWQIQKDGCTIQKTIQDVMKVITHEEVKIVGSGRTDAGVHALGQVFHFDTELKLSEGDWKIALNTLLPSDIRVKEIEFVLEDFHARFSAVKKVYQYYLNMGEFNPFAYQTVFQYGNNLDVDKMAESAKALIGKHDFTSFCVNKKEVIENRVKELYDISIIKTENIVMFEFVGKGFLRHMVRMMVATLIKVGEGKLTDKDVQGILEAKSKESCAFNAPACGLYLVEVSY